MAEHTPGPWRTQIDDKGDLRLIAGDGHMYWLGNVEDTCGECHANARLMSASPDLLEAVEIALQGYIDILQADLLPDHKAETQMVVNTLEAARLKAKGQGND